MAKSKRRRRRPPGAGPAPKPTAPDPERRARKEHARQVREGERKRARRSAAIRRALTFGVVGLIAVTVVYWFQRADAVRPVPAAAVDAAKAAGCTDVKTPLDSAPGGQHLAAGANYTYSQHPATSGFHDPSPLPIPPHVYPAPIRETRAVHNLEHGAVIMYYRQSGDGALSAAIVTRLTAIANGSNNTILAPYTDLPAGQALALTAWNKLQTCPASVTGPQARVIAEGFIHAFVCTSNAPEAKAGQGC